MKLVLMFPCKLIGVDSTKEAEGFQDRNLIIENVELVRLAYNPKEKSVGLNVRLTLPPYPKGEDDAAVDAYDQQVEAMYDAVAAQTGWKKTTDWDDQPCLFRVYEQIGHDLGVMAAGEFWVSHEVIAE